MVGRNGLTKDVLLGIFSDAGAEDPASHLATGNVTFQADGDSVALRDRVERDIEKVIGRLEPVFIRSIEHLRRQIERDPFENAPFDDVYERCVSFTSGPAIEIDFPLSTPRGDAVAFSSSGDDIFSVTRLVGGRPGTMGKVLERSLARPVTTRNWNTVELIVNRSDQNGSR